MTIETGWQERMLGELCSFRRELMEPTSTGAHRYIGLEHIDPGLPSLRRWGTDRHVKSTKSQFYAGDILYGKLRPYLDKAAVAEWHGLCSTDILTLQPHKDEADSQYIGFLLHTSAFLSHAVATTSGVNHPRTSWTDIARFSYPVPPLPEQRAIAAVLSKIQVAMEVQDKLVTKLKELKAATMAKLFREGLHGEPLKQTEVGEIPRSWEVVQFEACLDSQVRYGVGKLQTNAYGLVGRYPIIDQGQDPVAGYTNDESLAYRGSLPVIIFGDHTRVFKFLAQPFVVGADGTKILHPNKNRIDERFFYYALTRLSIPSRGYNRHYKLLREQQIAVPMRIEEQRLIAQILWQIDERLAMMTIRRDTMRSFFSSMLHLLMTGRVRVTPKMIALQRVADRAARRAKWSGKIDEKVLEEVVKRIVEAVAPEKIILFGSAARGEMGPDSDLDLLIVKSDVHRLATAQMIEHSLTGITIPTDIVVATPKDIEVHRNTIGLIYRPALQEGKILYAA